MALKLVLEECTITTRHPFAIARGSTTGYQRCWVRLIDEDGLEGWGEADPSSYYGETYETVVATLRKLERHVPADPFDLEAAEARFAQVVPRASAAARAALSAALHDLGGKRLGQPLWRLWRLDPRKTPESSFTIGSDTPTRTTCRSSWTKAASWRATYPASRGRPTASTSSWPSAARCARH